MNGGVCFLLGFVALLVVALFWHLTARVLCRLTDKTWRFEDLQIGAVIHFVVVLVYGILALIIFGSYALGCYVKQQLGL